MLYKRILPFVIALLAFPFLINAQVTTSSISGTLKSTSGETLEGATITAIHQPTGTRYVTLANKSATFTLPGLRPGGPYTITMESVGYKKETVDGVTLVFGDPYHFYIHNDP